MYYSFLTNDKNNKLLCCNIEIRDGQMVVLNTIDKNRIILGFAKHSHPYDPLGIFELI